MIRCLSAFLALVLYLGLPILAQTAETPVTADDVVKMVAAGISDSVVLTRIHQFNKPLDLSTEQILQLKHAGVSDAVVRELLDPELPLAAQAFPQPVDSDDPLAIHEPGIYAYIGGSESKEQLIRLERSAYQRAKVGDLAGSVFSFGIAKMKLYGIIPGAASTTRLPGATSVFYFYFEESAPGRSPFSAQNISSPNQFALMRLVVQKKGRAADLGEVSIRGASVGANSKYDVPFKSERVRPGLYKVTVASPVQPGEYCFTTMPVVTSSDENNQPALPQDVFDFGVD